MKKINIGMLVLILAAVCGCESTPLPEINYRGEMPPTIKADYPLIKAFAGELAVEAGLIVSGGVEPTGNAKLDAGRYRVELSTKETPKIIVSIDADETMRVLFVQVRGAIEDPRARFIGNKAEEIYSRDYSGAKLTEFVRHRGLLGP